MKTRLFEKYVDSGLMTQRQLADTLGFSEEHLSRIKHGRIRIQEGFVARVCMTLHVPRDFLFYRDDEEAGTVAARDRASA